MSRYITIPVERVESLLEGKNVEPIIVDDKFMGLKIGDNYRLSAVRGELVLSQEQPK